MQLPERSGTGEENESGSGRGIDEETKEGFH